MSTPEIAVVDANLSSAEFDRAPTARWSVQLLGQLRVVREADGVDARFETRKIAGLFAYLAYHPRRAPLREELIEHLWPDADLDQGRSSLRTALAAMRRLLDAPDLSPGAVVIADRHSVRLAPEAVRTDVAAFETALAAAGRASTVAERIARLEEAVLIYQGELLPGHYETWILPERERLVVAQTQALHELATALLAAGEPTRAIEHARRAVQTDPLDEPARYALIRGYAAAGQLNAARRHYAEWEQLLQDELGETPSLSIDLLLSTRKSSRTSADRPREEGPRPETAGSSGKRPTPDTDPDAHAARRPPTTPSPRPERALRRRAGVRPLYHSAAPAGATTRASAVQSRLPPSPKEAGSAGSLPLPLTPFFGREAEIEQIGVLLTSPDVRLVTLTGLGGTGKTRLAIEVARRLQDAPHGMAVAFVPLVDLVDPALISNSVRATLGLPTTADPISAIANALADRRSLLVLDNFEQLTAGGAEVVRTLLERVPGARCLITSRMALDMQAEWEYPVAPLPTPAAPTTTERLMEFASVRVFVSRAQAARPGFQLTAENARTVAQLCQALEGLPLALELAAARAQVLTPAQMLQHMSDRFGFLIGRHRDVAERHRTLRAVLAWSYQSLPESHRRLLACLAVFRGGWTLAAAEAICGDTEDSPLASAMREGIAADTDASLPLAIQHPKSKTPNSEVLDVLMDLRDASLLITDEVGGEMRFRMLETVREYAWERLKESGEEKRLLRSHRNYFLALVEAAATGLEGPEQDAMLERLESEHDNLRAALEFCAGDTESSEAGLRLTAGLYLFWDQRGHFTEARARYTTALTHPQAQRPTPARAACLRGAGMIDENLSAYRSARALFEEALAIGNALNDADLTASLLGNLGTVAHALNDDETARGLFEQVLALSRQRSDAAGIARAVNNLGMIAARAGDDMKAQRYFEEGLAMAREKGNRRGIAASLIHLGHLRRRRGELAAARACFAESLAIRRDTSNPWGISAALVGLAMVAREEGHDAVARPMLEETVTITRGLGDRSGLLAAIEHLTVMAATAGDTDAARRLLAEGLALRRELHEPDVGIAFVEAATLLAAARARWLPAALLAGAAARQRTGMTAPLFPELDAALSTAHDASRASLAAETFAYTREAGKSADLEVVWAAVAAECEP